MGFVEHQPVWPAGARAQVAQAWQQAREERRPVGDRQTDQVGDAVFVRLGEQLHELVDARRPVGRAHGHGVLQCFVVAFRIDHAEGPLALGQPFEQAGGQARLAAARRADEQQVRTVGLHVYVPVLLVAAKDDAVPLELRPAAGKVIAEQLLDELGHAGTVIA